MKILVVNLGSTSTKAGIFEDKTPLAVETFRHSKEDIAGFATIQQQRDFRKVIIEAWLQNQGYALKDFSVFAMRGGIIRPLAGGVYHITNAIRQDAETGRYGEHASNIGLLIGYDWSQATGIPAVFIDAPCTDELSDVARISGFKGVERTSIFHALNAKRVIHMYCRVHQLDPYQGNYIVAHMGGGISVSAYQNLRAIDVSNGVDGEGPFSPERVGSLSHKNLFKLVNQYQGDTEALRKTLYYRGGLMSYFGTNHVEELVNRAQKEPEVALVLDALCYNVAKQIGAMAAVLTGQVNQIMITGGMAYSQFITDKIRKQVDWIAECTVYPGEDELAALAEGAYRYATGQEEAIRVE